jgi:hypothetical protein
MRVPIGRMMIAIVATLLPALPAAAAPPDYTQGDYLMIFTREIPGAAGALTLMDMNPPWDHDDNYLGMHYDVWACFHEGLVYLVNRQDADNIQILDPQDDFATVRQFSVGAGANPQEICFVDATRAFVTRYDDTDLWEVDPSTGSHTDTIDLSPLADADGLPEMQGMAIHGGLLYVTVQRLDRDAYWAPVPPSYLAVIDLADNALLDMDPATPGVQGIPLCATNPNYGIERDPRTGDFLICEAGDFLLYDGGIERFDPVTQQSAGLIVTEAQLQGELTVGKTADGIALFAIYFDASYQTRVVACDLASGAVTDTIASAAEYAYAQLHIDPSRGQLFVADRGYADPGIRIFDLETYAPLSAGAIRVGLYPLFLLPMHGPHSEVPGQPAAPSLALSAAPSPAAATARLRFRLPRAQEIDLAVFDAAGRRLATLARGAWPAGEHTVAWNGDDRRGVPAPAGSYFARLRGARDGQRAARILHLGSAAR